MMQARPSIPAVALRPGIVAIAAIFAAVPIGLIAASAQAPNALTGEPSRAFQPPPPTLDTLKHRDKELEALRAEQRKAVENEARLKREIETLGDDRRKFNQQIIDTASRVTGVEDRISQTQERIAPLDDREQALRGSLAERRGTIAEVLAALQRMGRQTPPGIVLRAEDALQAVRSAMLLGAVLPEMRQQAETLAVDLNELVRLRKQLGEERDRLARDLLALASERHRLSLFIEERQKRQADTEKALTDERQHATQLARQAENLNQLIVKLEKGLDTASRAARADSRSADESKASSGRPDLRSEERRVGKEGRYRGRADHEKQKGSKTRRR